MSEGLAGIGVLVTRPLNQAEGLAKRIREQGGTAVLLPAIDILPPTHPHELADRIGRIREFDLIVFVSPTAVEWVWPHILARHGDWPHGFRVAAIGQGTVRALRGFGLKSVLAPEDGSGSERLLAMPELSEIPPRHVLIVRGEGGRETLAEGLTALGAKVEYAECYRRDKASLDPAPIIDLWRQQGIQAVTVTSAQILDNLFELLGKAGQDLLLKTPMFVHHPRIVDAARAKGVAKVIETESDEVGMLQSLVSYFTNRHD